MRHRGWLPPVRPCDTAWPFRQGGAGIAPPIDGVRRDLADHDGLEDAARRLAGIGFAGKFRIHPAQAASPRRGLRPSPEAPVRHQAQRIIDAEQRLSRLWPVSPE